MTIHLYGIPNCDTVRKARKWLEAEGRDHVFHDFKKEGVEPAKVRAWIAETGLEVIVNRRGTTFRKLSEDDKAASHDSHSAVALLVQHPNLIKRPVVEHERGLLIGFKENEWSQSLS